jgi:hypothetical protein
VKVYCPEISLGLMTQEEVADVQAVVVETLEPEASSAGPAPAIPQPISRADSRSVATEPEQTVSDGESQATTAETAPAPRRSSRRTAAAQTQSPSNAKTDSDGTQQPADPPAAASAAAAASSTGSGAPSEGGPSGVVAQAELLMEPPPAPANAKEQPSSADLLRTAQQEIPKLATAEALENARQRVNRLLAEGQLNDEGAERLWTLIDRRLQQIQATAQQEGEP